MVGGTGVVGPYLFILQIVTCASMCHQGFNEIQEKVGLTNHFLSLLLRFKMSPEP